jgi:hypothetical protein
MLELVYQQQQIEGWLKAVGEVDAGEGAWKWSCGGMWWSWCARAAD